MKYPKIVTALLFALNLSSANAENHFSTSLFIDSYSAQSNNKLNTEYRPYFTQASQNNDYHLNLASAGIEYDDELIRGKLAGQYGDSVDINYNQEPQDSFKFVQESYVGFYLNELTTIDAGTFFSHIGAESWISKNNLNYTRSLIAEFSPYYETGIRLSHTVDENWSVQLLGLNGWQNTTDNRHPALGTQVSYTCDDLTLTSSTFVGRENYGTRLFHDFIAKKNWGSGLSLISSIDVGYQGESDLQNGTWWGYSIIGRQTLTDLLSMNARFESYQDPDQVIVTSTTGHDFRASAVSLGLDTSLGKDFLIRGEVKHLFSPNRIFTDDQDETNNETIFVVSLSFSNGKNF